MAEFDRAHVTLDGLSVEGATPFFDQAIVRPLTPGKERASGLVLPDHVTGCMAGDLLNGECVAVGDGAWTSRGARVPAPCKPGDLVTFIIGFGREVEFQEGPHWVIGRGAMSVGFQHGVIL